MKHLALLSLAMMLCLSTAGVEAKTYVTASGDVYHEKKHNQEFEITGDGKQKLKLTVGCKSNKAGSGTMRIYFYKKTDRGDWDQIDHLRLQINGNKKESSDTFKLSPGQYKVQIKVRRMEYNFKLEDA